MNRSKFFAVLAFLFALAAPLVVMTTVEAQSSTFGDGLAVPFDDEGRNDGVRIDVAGVSAPPQGKEYVAWMVTDDSEGFLNLGSLTVANGTVAHTFDSESEGYDGANLIQMYSGWAVSVENFGTGANLDMPSNRGVVYDMIPSETMAEVRKLDAAAHQTAAQLALAMNCAQIARVAMTVEDAQDNLQCVVNLLEGESGDNYDASAGNSGGDGMGVLAHIAATRAASQSLGNVGADRADASFASAVASSASANADMWASAAQTQAANALTIGDLAELKIFVGPGGNTVISLLDAALNGFDANGDGVLNEQPLTEKDPEVDDEGELTGPPEPGPSETGAKHAARAAQLAATLRATAGELPVVATPTPLPTATPAPTATPTPIPQPAGPGLPGVGGVAASGPVLAMALAAALAVTIGGLSALRANRRRNGA